MKTSSLLALLLALAAAGIAHADPAPATGARRARRAERGRRRQADRARGDDRRAVRRGAERALAADRRRRWQDVRSSARPPAAGSRAAGRGAARRRVLHPRQGRQRRRDRALRVGSASRTSCASIRRSSIGSRRSIARASESQRGLVRRRRATTSATATTSPTASCAASSSTRTACCARSTRSRSASARSRAHAELDPRRTCGLPRPRYGFGEVRLACTRRVSVDARAALGVSDGASPGRARPVTFGRPWRSSVTVGGEYIATSAAPRGCACSGTPRRRC